jgi:type IV pilus assembly protein PilE
MEREGMQQAQRGFSLVELMVAVVIVGILAAIAYPSYRAQVMRGGRAEAKQLLMAQSQALEKCFTRFGVYDNAACAAATQVLMGPEGRYQLRVTAITPTTYTLTATPQGGQSSDADCGAFTLDETGGRGVTGPLGVQQCW